MYLLIGIISIGQIDSFAIEHAIVAARNRIPSWQCDYAYEVEGKKESTVHGTIYWRKDHVRYDVIRDSDHQYDFMAIFTPQFYLKIFSFGPGRTTNLIIERPADIDKGLNPDQQYWMFNPYYLFAGAPVKMMRRARGDKPIVGTLDTDDNYIFHFDESRLPSILKCSPKFDLLPVEYSADQYPLNHPPIKPALIYRYEWTRYGEVIGPKKIITIQSVLKEGTKTLKLETNTLTLSNVKVSDDLSFDVFDPYKIKLPDVVGGLDNRTKPKATSLMVVNGRLMLATEAANLQNQKDAASIIPQNDQATKVKAAPRDTELADARTKAAQHRWTHEAPYYYIGAALVMILMGSFLFWWRIRLARDAA